MAFRPTSRDLTAGILTLVAALIWSVWGARELRRRSPGPVQAPAPAAAPAASAPPPSVLPPPPPPASASASPDEARRLLVRIRGEGRERRAALIAQWRKSSVPEALIPELLAFVREALGREPSDPEPLSLLCAIPGERGGDALLEFAALPWFKEVRVEACRLAGERGYTEAQLQRLPVLFAAERDDDVRVGILIGASKCTHPAAEALARRALADPEETVRGVALASLSVENELDRRLLIGLAMSDPSDQVRGSAALLLNDRAGDPAVLDAILSVALKDASPDNRRSALVSLRPQALQGDARVLETLQWSASKDGSPEVRTLARSVLDGLKKKK